MKKVIIVHRWDGNSEVDWYPWLKTELEKLGYEVVVPNMPDIGVPVIEKWVGKLAEVVGTPDVNTYFIGHSIGCQAILRYLQTLDTPVGGAIFVAGWFDLKNLESPEVVQIAAPWVLTPLHTEVVRSVLTKSVLIISDNDPYDCFEYNKKEFAALGSKIVVMPKAGHITAEDGYSQCPEILKEFNTLI